MEEEVPAVDSTTAFYEHENVSRDCCICQMHDPITYSIFKLQDFIIDIPSCTAPPASSTFSAPSTPATSSLPWPGLKTCLASDRGDECHAKLLQDHMKTSSNKNPKTHKRYNPSKKGEQKQLVCDYCDKIFDVREIDTIP